MSSPVPTRSPMRRGSHAHGRASAFAWLLGALCLTLAASCGVSESAATVSLDDERVDQAGVERDEWLALRLDGQPGGYLHTVVQTRDDGLVSTWAETRFRLARLRQELVMTIEMTYLEGPDGEVHRLGQRTLMPEETITSAVIAEGRMSVEISGSTGERHFDREWPAGHLGPEYWHRGLISWAQTAAPGQSYTMRQFDLQIGEPTEIVNELVVRSDEGFEVATTMTALPGIVTTTRYDPAGRTLFQGTKMLGMDFSFEACSREEALAAFSEGGLAPEAFASTVIRPDRPLPRPRALDRVVLRLRARDPSIPLPDFESSRQAVVEHTDDGLVLEIRRRLPGDAARDPARDAAREPVPGTAPGDEFLAPNATIQSDDPTVIALANELAGGASAPWDVARRLERGVYEFIDKKSFGVAFATAAEVCRSREGDCSEHAVLLAALARAAEIPSRVAMGLTYVGGIFGGHAWTEVWIDGEWIALDGTNGLGSVDAAHIRFGTSSLDGLGMGAEMFAALMGLANLDIELVETEHDGRVQRWDQGASSATLVVDDVLVSHEYGFRLTAPQEFTWTVETNWMGGVLARARAADGRRLSVRARAVGYEFDEQDLGTLQGAGDVAIRRRVDDRPALLSDGGGWHLATLDGDTVIVLALDAEGGPLELELDEDQALELLTELADGLEFEG